MAYVVFLRVLRKINGRVFQLENFRGANHHLIYYKNGACDHTSWFFSSTLLTLNPPWKFLHLVFRLRSTVRTSTHLKSSNAHSCLSRLVDARKIVSTAHSHHTTRHLSRHKRCWTLEKSWTLLARPRQPAVLGKMHIITGVEPQGRSIKKQDGLNLTQPFVFLLWVCIYSFCMGAAWRDLAGRKSNFNKILNYVTEIRWVVADNIKWLVM